MVVVVVVVVVVVAVVVAVVFGVTWRHWLTCSGPSTVVLLDG